MKLTPIHKLISHLPPMIYDHIIYDEQIHNKMVAQVWTPLVIELYGLVGEGIRKQ